MKNYEVAIYTDLQESDWVKQYPDLTEKDVVAEVIQGLALEMMPKIVEKNKLEEFVNESEKSFTESTFKKYIANYPEFLDNLEQEFYN